MVHAKGTACAKDASIKEGAGGHSGDWKKATLTEMKRGDRRWGSRRGDLTSWQTMARLCKKSSGKPLSSPSQGVGMVGFEFPKDAHGAEWRKSCVDTNVEAPAGVQERPSGTQTTVVASETEGRARLESYSLRQNNRALVLNCLQKMRVKPTQE